jgi:hypothetical protein
MHGTSFAEDVVKATTPPGGKGIFEKVVQAQLLLVNPDHYAVAVKRGADGSIQIIERGSDDAALAMISAANAAGVPVVRDPETARALYSGNVSASSASGSFSGSDAIISGGAISLGTVSRGERPEPMDGNTLLKNMMGAMADVGGFLSGLATALLDALLGALKALGAGISDILGAVFGFITDAFRGAGDIIGKILSYILGPIADALSGVGDLLATVLGAIFAPISKLVCNLPDFLAGLFHPLAGLFVGVGDFLMGILEPIFSMDSISISGFFQQLWDLVFDSGGGGISLESIGQKIIGAVFDFTKAYGNVLTTIWDKVTGFIESIFAAVGIDIDIGKTIQEGLDAIFGGDIFAGVMDIGDTVGKALDDLFGGDLFAGFGGLGDILQTSIDNIFALAGGSGEEIKLLPNPFHSAGLGPDYFIKFKMEEGGSLEGLAQGPSHGRGGIPGVVGGRTPIEFEGGEFIMSKKAVDNIGVGALNTINENGKKYQGGGRAEEEARRWVDKDKAEGDGSHLFNLDARIGGTIGGALNGIGLPDGLYIKGGPAGVKAGLHGGLLGSWSSDEVGDVMKTAFQEGGAVDFNTGKPFWHYWLQEFAGIPGEDFQGWLGMMPKFQTQGRGGGRAMSLPMFTDRIKWDQGTGQTYWWGGGNYTESPGLGAIAASGSPMSVPSSKKYGRPKWTNEMHEIDPKYGRPKGLGDAPGERGTDWGRGEFGYGDTSVGSYKDAQSNPWFANSPSSRGGYSAWQRALFNSEDFTFGDNGLFELLTRAGYDAPFMKGDIYNPQHPVLSLSMFDFIKYAEISAGQPLGSMGAQDLETIINIYGHEKTHREVGMVQNPHTGEWREHELVSEGYLGKPKGWTPETASIKDKRDKVKQDKILRARWYDDYISRGLGKHGGKNKLGGSLHSNTPASHSFAYLDSIMQGMGVMHPFWDEEKFRKEEVDSMYPYYQYAGIPPGRGSDTRPSTTLGGGYSGFLNMTDMEIAGDGQYKGADEIATAQNLITNPGTTTNEVLALDVEDYNIPEKLANFLGISRIVDTIVEVFENVPILGWLGEAIGSFLKKIYKTVTSELLPSVTAKVGIGVNPPKGILEGGLSYGRGGIVSGPSHSDGGVGIYAEGGEYIVNKNATKKHYGLLSKINSYQEGGQVESWGPPCGGGLCAPWEHAEWIGQQLALDEAAGGWKNRASSAPLGLPQAASSSGSGWNPGDVLGVRTTENVSDSGSWLSKMEEPGGTMSEEELGSIILTAENTGTSSAILQDIRYYQDTQYEALQDLITGIEFTNNISLQGNDLMHMLITELNRTLTTHIQASTIEVKAALGKEAKKTQDLINGTGTETVFWKLNNIKNTKLPDIGSNINNTRREIIGKFSPSLSTIKTAIDDNCEGEKCSKGFFESIFSDRSVKSFRSGGMTESQQTDVLRKVQPHTYRYKSGGPVQTGFMAQDLERTSFGRQYVHNSPAGKYVDGGIIGPLLASQSIMQSRMDSYQGGGVVAPSGISEALLQGIIDAIQDQDMNVNVYTNTEDEVGQMMGSSNNASAEADYRDVVDYA